MRLDRPPIDEGRRCEESRTWSWIRDACAVQRGLQAPRAWLSEWRAEVSLQIELRCLPPTCLCSFGWIGLVARCGHSIGRLSVESRSSVDPALTGSGSGRATGVAVYWSSSIQMSAGKVRQGMRTTGREGHRRRVSVAAVVQKRNLNGSNQSDPVIHPASSSGQSWPMAWSPSRPSHLPELRLELTGVWRFPVSRNLSG